MCENFKSNFAKTVSLQCAKNVENMEKKDCEQQESPVRFRKTQRNLMDDSRRFSCGSLLSRRYSQVSETPEPNLRRPEIPVENMYNQSKIETLQWQLKEIEKSREMYRALMKQIVTFLEKAHISLETLSTKMHRKPLPEPTESWTPKKPDSQEIHPDKLSSEAFRLLRTAQSLLSTQEPNLASEDMEFLSQLAKEFPQKPQRTTSFSLSPKLVGFNRKLSLQLSEVRRRGEVEYSSMPPSVEGGKSVDSFEDESGFSSLNSFQDVGLPLVNSTGVEEVSARSVLLKSMLHNHTTDTPKSESFESDVKLWQKPQSKKVDEKSDKQLKVLWV